MRAVGTHYGADSDTSDLLKSTPSEGRHSWHYDTLSSPQLPPGRTNQRRTTGWAELLEDGHHRCYCQSRRTFSGTRAGWSSGRTTPE